jgi:trehalose-6-phosphate synthase
MPENQENNLPKKNYATLENNNIDPEALARFISEQKPHIQEKLLAQFTYMKDALEPYLPIVYVGSSKSPVFKEDGSQRPGGLGNLVGGTNIPTKTIDLQVSFDAQAQGPHSNKAKNLQVLKENGLSHQSRTIFYPKNTWEQANKIIVQLLWNVLHSKTQITLDELKTIPDLDKAYEEFVNFQIPIAQSIMVTYENEPNPNKILEIEDTYNQIHVAKILKEAGFQEHIATMHHIPFPSLDYIKSFLEEVPLELQDVVTEILKDFVSSWQYYDTIFMQTAKDKQNLLECSKHFCPEIDSTEFSQKIEINPATINLATFSKHSKNFEENGDTEGTFLFTEGLKKMLSLEGKKTIKLWELQQYIGNIKYVFSDIGTRIDPIKNILEKLEGYYIFLQNNPEMLGKTLLVQQVSPSRMDQPLYQKIDNEIKQWFIKINKEFPNSFMLVDEAIPHSTVLSFNHFLASIFPNFVSLITSTEGMSLAAQEAYYISSKAIESQKPANPEEQKTTNLLISDGAGWGGTLNELGYPFVIKESGPVITPTEISTGIEELINTHTSNPEKFQEAAQIPKGWLENHNWGETMLQTLGARNKQHRYNLERLKNQT